MIQESTLDVFKKLVLTEAATRLKKMPPNTKIYADALHWSSWDGKLSMVHGPSYYNTQNSASKEWFDPALMARKYIVQFAVDSNGKRLAPPSQAVIGGNIVVRDRRLPYHKTTWSMGTPNYGPVITGSFEPKQYEYLVLVKLKELGKAEVGMVTDLYDSYGYLDVSGYPKLKTKQANWKKLFTKRKFADTQNLDSDLANVADALIHMKNSFRYADDETHEQILWDAIQGVYSTNKKGDKISFIIKK